VTGGGAAGLGVVCGWLAAAFVRGGVSSRSAVAIVAASAVVAFEAVAVAGGVAGGAVAVGVAGGAAAHAGWLRALRNLARRSEAA